MEPSGFELNGDSSSVYVAEEYFSLSNLQPGRNYSISVQAVSKGIESVERSLFQATRKYNLSAPLNHSANVSSFCLKQALMQNFVILF